MIKSTYAVTVDNDGRVWAWLGTIRRCLFQIVNDRAMYRFPKGPEVQVGDIQVLENKIVLTLPIDK